MELLGTRTTSRARRYMRAYGRVRRGGVSDVAREIEELLTPLKNRSQGGVKPNA